jgi:hypothetical protein
MLENRSESQSPSHHAFLLITDEASQRSQTSDSRSGPRAALRGGVEFSDDFFIVKHHQSLAQLVTDHLVLRQGVAAVQRIR